MSNFIDNGVELLPLKESNPYICDDETLNCAEGISHHKDVACYGSTFLTPPPPPTQGPVTRTGKRPGVLPLFRERIREGSLRIRDKGRRRKEQEQEQRLTGVHTDEKCPQQDTGSGKEFPSKTTGRDPVAQKIRCRGNRFDSEFDISEALARSKAHTLRPKKFATRG